MKSFWKLLVILAGLSLVVGFFLPWFTMNLPGSLATHFNGLEIFKKIDSILPLTKERPYLLPYSLFFFPALGLFAVLGSSFRLSPILIFIAGFIVFAYLVYLAVDIAQLAQKVQKEFAPINEMLKNLGGSKKPIKMPSLKELFQLGNGLWLTLGALILLMVSSFLQSRAEKSTAN